MLLAVIFSSLPALPPTERVTVHAMPTAYWHLDTSGTTLPLANNKNSIEDTDTMGMSRIAFLSFSVLLVLSGAARAELPKNYQIILQTDNFPPFNMGPNHKNFARGDEVLGIATDTVREIFKRAGIDYSLTLRSPWDRIYSQTLADAGHGLFSVTRTVQNEGQFKWVGPLARYESVLLAAADTRVDLRTLMQAKGLQIGVQKSSGVSQYLESQGLRPTDSLSEEENLRKLLSGRLDLWATADPVWRYHVREHGAEGIKPVLNLRAEDLYLALHKDTPDEAVERLQRALNEVIGEGYAGCSKTPDLCYLIRDRKAP
ncbi:polar amino acid transport system substrate-binding protein [Stutzerimonas xanthomarina]|uniref:Amino acid ABC transporter substrate-binding protein, PAAT family n=3 Tax=Stutzerimonas xanthomarina TaxID=271420 RepID=A0A1M5TNR4_9GAMM|nr:polar amino acid transport system substrate-binding protein [Stutzerimonas xanthomarina]SHH52276.1 amino acid ABC transporter substrate-binding protein, PAAT family [Stutzerimonas xanthomarina DSM 18231]